MRLAWHRGVLHDGMHSEGLVFMEGLPLYDGIVAFDFGTTDSYAVVFDHSARAPRIVPLDDGEEPGMPSVILHQRLLDERTREYEVGFYAKSLAPLCPESAVQSIKRFLGMHRRVPVRFREDGQRREYRPEEIAQDIIARMIERVQEWLGCKIGACIITYPATFAPAQVEALRSAFTRCGVEISMMIHEPVATAVHYLLHRVSSGSPYTLMVYDCGCGTTDTLIEVTDTIDPRGRRVIAPKILGACGRQRFGGDDVTEAVAQDLCCQFNRHYRV